MGGARSLLGVMKATTGLTPGADAGAGTRLPLDEALKRLQDRGPFMGKLVAKLRAQQATVATPPATTIAGTQRGVASGTAGAAFQPIRSGFMGGY
ncbi:MAG TPA: hypothetical protein VGR82_17540 [Methylomirabilota bacterium]|jgi:hypothetical protein|nr:hypothetical protein [Methylomirabilota bacterium]